MSPAAAPSHRTNRQPPVLLTMTSPLPTPGASSYCSPPAHSKSLQFYCQGGSRRDLQSDGRPAGDMGQRILRVDVFTSHGGQPKEEGKCSTRWDSSVPSSRLKLCQDKKSIFPQWCRPGWAVVSVVLSESTDLPWGQQWRMHLLQLLQCGCVIRTLFWSGRLKKIQSSRKIFPIMEKESFKALI